MSGFSDNIWAREMGIDLELLRSEDPFHPFQLRNHREIELRGQAFWNYRRMTAGPEYSPEAISDEISDSPASSVKTPRKAAKVRRYEFTEAQLEIARRSLDAGGSV